MQYTLFVFYSEKLEVSQFIICNKVASLVKKGTLDRKLVNLYKKEHSYFCDLSKMYDPGFVLMEGNKEISRKFVSSFEDEADFSEWIDLNIS